MRRVEAFRGEITQLFCWRFFRLSLFRYKSPRSQACRTSASLMKSCLNFSGVWTGSVCILRLIHDAGVEEDVLVALLF